MYLAELLGKVIALPIKAAKQVVETVADEVSDEARDVMKEGEE